MFSFDLSFATWTDAVGNPEGYALGVSQWSELHDLLPDTNSNKIPETMGGTSPQAQLNGHSVDLREERNDDELNSQDGDQLILNMIHIREPLSVISGFCADFNDLLLKKPSSYVTLRDLECRVASLLSRYKAIDSIVHLPDDFTAMLPLANSAIIDAQGISIVDTAAPKAILPMVNTVMMIFNNSSHIRLLPMCPGNAIIGLN